MSWRKTGDDRLDAAFEVAEQVRIEAFKQREARRKEARDAAFKACIAILNDPESKTWEKFRAMKILQAVNFMGPRGRKVGSPHRRGRPPKAKQPELPQALVDEVLATYRSIDGHQNKT
jgi:hypothetical protein